MSRARTPVLRTPLDLPADRLAPAVGALEGPALLEGGAEFGEAGRWSLFAAEPRMVFESDGHRWSWSRPGGLVESAGVGDPLAALAPLLAQHIPTAPEGPPDPELPPFPGGFLGYYGYDLAPWLEDIPRKAPADSRLPVVRFALHDWSVAVDHRRGAVVLSVADLDGLGGLEAQVRDLNKRFQAVPVGPVSPKNVSRPEGPLRSEFGHDAYLSAVARALEYIRAGDIFQVNLSQRFSTVGRFDPLALYLRLRRVSPAPFSAFLRWGDMAVVGASPEWFFRTRGDRVVTRPIKGTRPRGRTVAEDRRLADELWASPKDRAELTMIVDLERNDLGRVCRYGSVRVAGPLTIESYAQVHHLVATVEGRLRPEVGPIDLVRATFPGGSITGAPKVRAMQIIDELEPTRRGLYTGAVGYYGLDGSSGFNIAIRTILVEGDRVSYQVGGGIVADSVPELEHAETLHKGRGLRSAIEGEATGLSPGVDR
jgi:para-aminobenzoate synthetase component 1